MSDLPTVCPKCGSEVIAFIEKTGQWLCTNTDCNYRWTVNESERLPVEEESKEKVSLFLSYGRRDAKELADRLCVDLAAAGYEV